MKYLLSFLLLIPFSPAFAHHNSSGPVLMVLQGVDSQSRRPCRLMITGVEQSHSGVSALRAYTDYGHGTDHPPEMLLRLSPQRPDMYVGTSPNGRDEMALFVSRSGDPQSAQSFNLRWWHHNHFDTFQCLQMQVIR